MAQKTLLQAKGLFTDPNFLSGVPEGAQSIADNVIIDRDEIIEPRRGFAQYGNEFGIGGDRAKQLLNYKNRILIHYNDTLLFNDNAHTSQNNGNFLAFDGVFEELTEGLRIKSVESNRNLYFTTNDGIKKISASTASDFTTAPNFITDAGGLKALDVTGNLDVTSGGFLPANSKTAYRVVWGYRDANDNLILGSPSSRLVVTNSNEVNGNVILSFVIPTGVTSSHFYQIYRSATFTATGNLSLDDIDPGDELNLVIEDFPSGSAGDTVTVTDIAPEDFRAGGAFLYTNPVSGEGINQANEPPPKAKDITMYQSTVFYANTETRASVSLNLLSVSSLVTGVSTITIDDTINPSQTYTFIGDKENTTADFSAYTGTIPADLDGKYWLINSASNKRKYYVWYDDNLTTQTIDFSNFVGTIPSDLDGRYFVLYTGNENRSYYVWYDATGTTSDPGLNPANTNLIGLLGIKVDISAGVTTKADVASVTSTAISTADTFNDFDVTYVALAESLTVDTISFDDSTSIIETIQQGFGFTIDTPINNDPANTPLTNTDVVGRIPIRVDVSRLVTTKAQIADATAAAFLSQDDSNDFNVSYTATNEFLDIENTNNGNTDDAIDSTIEGVGNSFAITINNQGDGEGLRGTISATTTGATITITSNDHGLTNGETIEIINSDTTPSIDGTHTVSSVTANTFDITPASPVTVAGTAGTWYQNEILLSDAASPAQQIDETARSIVNIINKNLNDSVYAYYLSGPTDIPGQILLQVRDIGVNQFNVTANNTATGGSFNPALPPAGSAVTGEVEIKPNRIYYAKLQQPEAVPLLNFIDVGPQDKAISRILALRESLFILKEDGIYRLTGLNGNFTVDLFDESIKIVAPDTAVVLNNQIYCLTNSGIATISDTNVQIISKQLDNVINNLIGSDFNFEFTSFGVSYETDRAYLIWLPTSITDTVATQAYRYNAFTQSWTRFPISKTCGLVNSFDNKLYLGPADENFIERERKNFNRTDYADRQHNISIVTNGVNGNIVALSTSQLAQAGDAIVQNQYLTINQYNQLLKKLDLDPLTGEAEDFTVDFSAYTGGIPNDLHTKYWLLNSASDSAQFYVFYDAVGNVNSLDPVIFSDIRGRTPIRVNISSGITTKADLAQKTRDAIQSATQRFIIDYTNGNEFLDIKTIRNGETTDPVDSLQNGVGNGFSIVINTQGFGDYLSTLEMLPGNNILGKLDDLATKLDSDPAITQTDFVSAIDDYSNTGSAVTFGNPTSINSIAHGLQDGRLVVISNSTTTPNIDGSYIITKIDDDNFSIDIETTSGGTCDWTANVATFQEAQAAFNTIIKKLNSDTGISYSNYPESSGIVELEGLITQSQLGSSFVTMDFSLNFIEGDIILYKAINNTVLYTPMAFGDPSLMKHIREGTFIFENNNFSAAQVGYKTDLSPGIDLIDFSKSGKGDFSLFGWDQHNWGGGFSGIPLRTYIPRQKQRCRYIQAQFSHKQARERWALLGISYTMRGISEKAYRGS